MKVFTAAATIPDQNVHIGNFAISFNNSFQLLETICSYEAKQKEGNWPFWSGFQIERWVDMDWKRV